MLQLFDRYVEIEGENGTSGHFLAAHIRMRLLSDSTAAKKKQFQTASVHGVCAQKVGCREDSTLKQGTVSGTFKRSKSKQGNTLSLGVQLYGVGVA